VIESVKHKILPLYELTVKLGELRARGKTIVQSHGVFDLIHPGIINHLEQAKRQGEVLVVTVIKDGDVRRGPGRPVFPDAMRVENVASLQMVDFVCAVDDGIPFECVKVINPDVFAKGQAYKERHRKIHAKIFEEERDFYFGKSKIFETNGFSFSSSHIVNNFLDIYPEDTRSFLRNFTKKYSASMIAENLNGLRDLKVLLIGDGIIDEYHYCSAMGKSAKSHLVVSKYLAHEVFYGGAFAIANHIAGLCDDVQLVSLLGSENSREHEIVKGLKRNVGTKFFSRGDGPTIVKKRYIDQYLNQKVFEVNYLNDEYIGGEREAEVIGYIEKTAGLYDIVLVSDFGHGLITDDIIRAVETYAKKYAVNTQTNAANSGYNMITKYRKPYYVCLDEPEIRLAAQERYANIEEVTKAIKRQVDADYLIVTLGKKGSIGVDAGGAIDRTPIFSSKVIDTIGAGDAFFAFTAPCFARGLPLDMVSFIGNAVGALAVQIVGNKKSVEKYELLAFIDAVLK
jgi:rfaE bifunctional protein kinase chain/domain